MRDLKKYVNECLCEIKDYGINIKDLPTDLKFVVNTRAKHRFGQCKYRCGKAFEINISSFMLDENILEDDNHLKNTIIHEILHALTPGDGHKGQWKSLANKVNVSSGGKYHIERCGSWSDMGIDQTKVMSPNRIKHIIMCPNCKHEWKYSRKTKAVKHPNLYQCGKCKVKLISKEIV